MAPVELKSLLINIKISEMPSCCCTEIGLMSVPGLPGDCALCFRSLFTPPTSLTFLLLPLFFSSSHYHCRFWKATLTNYDSCLVKHWLFTPNNPSKKQTLFYCNFIQFACYGLLMSSGDSGWMVHSRATMCLPKVIQSHCDYNNPEIIAVWCNAAYLPPFLSSQRFSIKASYIKSQLKMCRHDSFFFFINIVWNTYFMSLAFMR